MTADQAALVQQLADGGWDRESAKAAVESEDWTLLRHTGRVKIRLEPHRGEG